MPILPRAVLTSRDVRASVWLVAVLRIALGLAGLLTMVLDPRALLRTIAAWCAVAFVLLYRLARVDIGRRAAILTVLLVALSPVGFFLLAPYTEALFLATTVASFWLARTRHPWLAGIAGGAAGLTRLQGGLLLLPLGYLAWRDLRAGVLTPKNAPAWIFPAVGVFLALAYPRLVIGEA